MSVSLESYREVLSVLQPHRALLVAVSKTKPVSDIEALYAAGQRDFGENYVQELLEKQPVLPADINWHFIGHLQSNKVKYIAPFVHLIHGVDTLKLLQEINKQAVKNKRVINCLLQVHIAREETKFGFDAAELEEALKAAVSLPNVAVQGLMGMASFSNDPALVRAEFRELKTAFDQSRQIIPSLNILSMGMSGDYTMALEEGSTLVRIGSKLFGSRA